MSFLTEKQRREYGILCHRFYPADGLPTPFGSSVCVVSPGQSTAPHEHHEFETFFIGRGVGRITIDGVTSPVNPGDVVYLPAHSHHVLENLGGTPLEFVSVWWDDPARARKRAATRVMVTSAPPTPNGDLHLGHLSGPYIAADIHARYLRMRSVDARTVAGQDDNQSYTEVKAKALGRRPVDVARDYGERTLATLRRCSVTVDHWVRPSDDPGYAAYVRGFCQRLADRGALVARDAPSLWCPRCDRYAHEANVKGGCPHCGKATSGNGCEACGRTNDCVNLVDPTCTRCSEKCETRVLRRLYVPLEPHRERLCAYWARTAMSPRLHALTAGVLADGLPDVSATHVSDWGIQIGWPGHEGQVVYEWLEMAAGYVRAAEALSPEGRWQTYFGGDGGEWVQFYGIDNAFFYTTFIPAVLMAYDEEMHPPSAFVTNEFFQLEGLKFSTSRNHAVWGDELLSLVPADVVRFALAHSRPEHEETSFTVETMIDLVRRELVEGWEHWLGDLQGRIDAQGIVTAPAAGPLDEIQSEFRTRVEALARDVAISFEAATFSSRRATRSLLALVTAIREFAASQRWFSVTPGADERRRTALALELSALRTLALLASPVMPSVSAGWLAAVGETTPSTPRWAHSGDLDIIALIPTDRALGRLELRPFSPSLEPLRLLAARRAGGAS